MTRRSWFGVPPSGGHCRSRIGFSCAASLRVSRVSRPVEEAVEVLAEAGDFGRTGFDFLSKRTFPLRGPSGTKAGKWPAPAPKPSRLAAHPPPHQNLTQIKTSGAENSGERGPPGRRFR